MGSVDQADVKAHVINLTRQAVRKWHRKQLLFCVETAIINSFGNFNLDPGCKVENFKDWYNHFITELLDMSDDYRSYKRSRKRSRSQNSLVQRSRRKQETPKRLRRSKILPYGTPTKDGINCIARDNLAAFLRFTPKVGSATEKRPTAARRKCSFCGNAKTLHSCAGCKQAFCMAPPTHFTIPGSNPPRKYPSNGPYCWHRNHGFSTFGDMTK